MPIKKSLTSMVLTGALALGASGCSTHEYYHYNGKIGEEQVRFYETDIDGHTNILEVRRADGTVVRYVDYIKDDLRLEYTRITKVGKNTDYQKDIVGQQVLEAAQSQFDGYLAKILEVKQTKGLRDISGEQIFLNKPGLHEF